MRVYLIILAVVAAALSYEYRNLSKYPDKSQFVRLQKAGWIDSTARLTTKPGDSVSLWLGWAGISVMLIMNVYSLRKRVSFLHAKGNLKYWLDFHIFCGLLGPLFILFHCGLKARGVVAISFWSMIISFSSGVIGRYFYLQLLRKQSDFDQQSKDWLRRLRRVLEKAKIDFKEAQFNSSLQSALALAGARGDFSNPVGTLMRSIAADIQLTFRDPPTPGEWPPATKFCLKEFAVNTRRSRSLKPFQQLMGYWHAFHFPFAIFMYLAAIIHIISSLIFLKAS